MVEKKKIDWKKKKVYKKKSNSKLKIILEYTIYVFLFTNLFLLISSFWFNYVNFYIEIIIVSLFLGLSFFINKYIKKFTIWFTLFFYIIFLIFNFNYMFIFGICIILGVLGLNFIKPDLNVPQWIYSLIPVLILAHIIWFNVLPLGFNGSWVLDVGSANDFSPSSNLYIIDNNHVLSDRWSFGDKTWREFRKDGSFQIGFNTPIDLENKTVEISMEYEADSPIYINGKLFYDPAWGSSIELMNKGNVFVYGADVFNLTKNFKNVSLNKFLNVTNSSSLKEYVINKYGDEFNSDFEGEPSDILNKSAVENLSVIRVNLINGSFVSFNNLSLINISVVNSSFSNVSVLLKDTNISYDDIFSFVLSNGSLVNITNYYYTPKNRKNNLENFILDKGFNSSSEFMDFELNNGDYEKPRLKFNYSSIPDFMHAKYPHGVAMKDFTGKYPDLEKEMNSKYVSFVNSLEAYPDFTSSVHIVNTTFRGPVTFYGVFNNSINFSLEKKDLNNYVGSDNVLIQVSDLNKNIIANWSIPDNDGIFGKNKSSDWINYNFSLDINGSGIYKFKMIRNKSNKYEDFYIKDINFNSNKIIFESDKLLPMKPVKFYLQNGVPTEFYYWYNNKNQNIILDNETIYLTPKYKGKRVLINLTNTKTIALKKGSIRMYGDNYFSAWKNGWFNMIDRSHPVTLSKKVNYKNQNFDVTRFNNLTIRGYKGIKISSINIQTIEKQ